MCLLILSGGGLGRTGKEALAEPGEVERNSSGVEWEGVRERKKRQGRIIATNVSEAVAWKQKPGNHDAYTSNANFNSSSPMQTSEVVSHLTLSPSPSEPFLSQRNRWILKPKICESDFRKWRRTPLSHSPVLSPSLSSNNASVLFFLKSVSSPLLSLSCRLLWSRYCPITTSSNPLLTQKPRGLYLKCKTYHLCRQDA